ncbi:RNA polymerase I second largest subunit [Angomonas deanei]|nr:RNA polymerase I second largest subunit [Angomonas deanei]|eukprot:EPY42787.1 RNA polymerase I second largest subunit [Angomonas deanei]
MSAKHSLTSSAGETISSTHSSGSSRRRKLKLPQERIPPQFMGKEERLMHIRNAVTRLKYVQERILHMVSLDQAGGDDVNEILGQLQYLVPLLESNPHPNPVDQKDGPKQLDHLETEVKKLSKVVEEAIRMAEKTPNEEKSVYPGLKRKLLLESQQELHEIQELLTQKDGEVVSRVNTDGLQDMVSMHINDFDALFDTRLTAMVNERLREHSFFSATVRESFFPGAEPKGAVSPMLLDVVVGVRPSRCAYGVLHNAVKIIEKITERIETSKQVLESLEGKEGEDKKLVEFNLEKHVLLLEKTSTGLRHLESLQTRWTKEEEEIFKKVFVEKDLTNLLYAKRQSEDDIVTEAVRICDELLYEALPFASPQYCRRYSETYSNPCMLRLGFKLSSDYAQKDELNGKTHVALYSTSALFLKLMADRSIPEDKHREYDYLVPSSEQFWVPFGDFPEIVGGARCVLRGLKSKHDKFRALDEVKELGGYFIVNGGERILRALLMQRCNVPLNVERASFADLGVKFSEKAVTMRCKRQSGRTLYQYFYYSKTGNILLSFSRRTTWQVPVTLLTLCCGVDNPSTSELFRLLSVGLNVSANHKDRVETILQHHLSQPYGSLTHYVDYLSVLGRLYANYHETSMRFRFLPEFAANTQIHHDAWYGMFMLRAHLLPHLNAPVTTPPLAPDATPEELRAWLPEALQTELRNKFDVLIAAMRQLLVFNDGGSSHQGMDVPSYQEIFTVSQIFMCIFGTATSIFEKQIASRLAGVLPYTLFQALLTQNHKEMSNSMKQFREFATDALRGKTAPNYMAPVQKLLLTGTMKLEDDRDFYNPQNTGWSVLTDHLNFYRFFEQLRCVHRGTVIAGMRSSEVRRYPGEAYGFICMVHSPDGADCGVLNHLSVSTILSKGLYPDDEDTLHVSGKDSMKTLEKWIGKAFPQVRPTSSTATVDTYVETVPVWLEGKILGYTTPEEAEKGVTMLRKSKAITKRSMVGADGLIALSSLSPLHTLEVVYIPPENKEPKGVYLFCDSGRLMRPIQHIAGFGKESSTDLAFPHLYVGTWEQMWLDIAAVPSDLKDAVVQLGKKYEYMEQNGSNIILPHSDDDSLL